MKQDITTHQDVKNLVDSFYAKVRQDELLADIFNEKIKGDWTEHLEKMYSFWQTILFGEHSYKGSPFLPHAKLPVSLKHFKRWLKLFFETVDSLFEGEKATRAKLQGERMAEMFHSKIEYFKNNTSKPLM